MGVRSLRGRGLDDARRAATRGRWRSSARRSPNATCAAATRSASGSDYRLQGKPVEVEIVGVVASLRHERLDEAPRLEMFRPFAQIADPAR